MCSSDLLAELPAIVDEGADLEDAGARILQRVEALARRELEIGRASCRERV